MSGRRLARPSPSYQTPEIGGDSGRPMPNSFVFEVPFDSDWLAGLYRWPFAIPLENVYDTANSGYAESAFAMNLQNSSIEWNPVGRSIGRFS